MKWIFRVLVIATLALVSGRAFSESHVPNELETQEMKVGNITYTKSFADGMLILTTSYPNPFNPSKTNTFQASYTFDIFVKERIVDGLRYYPSGMLVVSFKPGEKSQATQACLNNGFTHSDTDDLDPQTKKFIGHLVCRYHSDSVTFAQIKKLAFNASVTTIAPTIYGGAEE